MFRLTSLKYGIASFGVGVAMLLSPILAQAKEVKIRVQSVIPAKADEVHMLNEFAADVAALTNGEVQIEVLPAGAVVGVKETLDAVDAGLIEGGFAWTIIGQVNTRQQCCLVRRWPVLAWVSTISRSCLGSNTAEVKNCMISCGRK